MRLSFNYTKIVYAVLGLFFLLSYSLAAFKIMPELKEYYFFFKDLAFLDLALVFFVLAMMSVVGFMSTTFLAFFGGFIMGYQSLIFLIPYYFLAQAAGYSIGYMLPGGVRAPSYLKEKLQAIVAYPARFVFWARLSPFLPFAALNIFCGVRRIRFRTYLLAGIAGMLPRTLFMIGLGVLSDSIYIDKTLEMWQWYWLFGSAAVSVIGLWYSFQILPKPDNKSE